MAKKFYLKNPNSGEYAMCISDVHSVDFWTLDRREAECFDDKHWAMYVARVIKEASGQDLVVVQVSRSWLTGRLKEKEIRQ